MAWRWPESSGCWADSRFNFESAQNLAQSLKLMIDRDLTPRLHKPAREFPAVTLTGPRQSGKSTLARAVFPDHAHANLEMPDVRDFAREDPRAFLDQFGEGAIVDSHYRDRHGIEADLIIDRPEGPILIEAKAATTISSGLLEGVRRVRDTLSSNRSCRAIVAYGGELHQKRSDLTLASWCGLHDQEWV